MDLKAFNKLIGPEITNDLIDSAKDFKKFKNNKKNSLLKIPSNSFATLQKNGKELYSKRLHKYDDVVVNTSKGTKKLSELSIHKGGIQVANFENEDLLLCRSLNSEYQTITTPNLRNEDNVLVTNEEVEIYLRICKINRKNLKHYLLSMNPISEFELVEAARHFTGCPVIGNDGEIVIEFSEDGKTRPKTTYQKDKGPYISAELIEIAGNVVSVQNIVKNTQKSSSEDFDKNLNHELVFIDKNHKSIKNIIILWKIMDIIRCQSSLNIENLNRMLKKHGLSKGEVAVELFESIDKDSNGVFHVNIDEFKNKNKELHDFILKALDEGFISKNSSCKLKILEEKDKYGEPTILVEDLPYEDKIDFDTVGYSDNYDTTELGV